jgi:hypothetical protein
MLSHQRDQVGSVEDWDLDVIRLAVERGGPATSEDVSITMDGRRLDSRDEVLAFLAALESERTHGSRRGA